MSTERAWATGPTWEERRHRAKDLLSLRPHSREILSFYLRLLDVQEALYRRALDAEALPRNAPDAGGDAVGGSLGSLPLANPVHAFRAFVTDVARIGTDLISAMGQALESADDASLQRLLGAFLAGEPLGSVASELDWDPLQLIFYPWAFLQPMAEVGASSACVSSDPGRGNLCPRCGRRPQVACIADEAEVPGRNRLICSLCAIPWAFPRSTCPSCRDADPGSIFLHLNDSFSHVRIAECRSCRGYLKSVDLRACPAAVPLVEDLATVELDLWCADHGLRKIQPNLLGF